MIEIVQSSALGNGCTEAELKALCCSSYCRVESFARGSYVFREEDIPGAIMLLLAGSVLIAKDTVNGKRMILSRITEPGDTFGEIYVFRQVQRYDMYAEAEVSSEVLFLDAAVLKADIPVQLQSVAKKLMQNQLQMFASKAFQMNRRLRVLGSASIREKVARFLIERQGGGKTVEVMSREDMADYLNVTRPALSREISRMVQEGILEIRGRTLVITNQSLLEEYI